MALLSGAWQSKCYAGCTIETKLTFLTASKFPFTSSITMNRAEVKQTISSELVNCGIKLTHAQAISNILCDQHFSDQIRYTASRIGCVGEALGKVKKKLLRTEKKGIGAYIKNLYLRMIY